MHTIYWFLLQVFSCILQTVETLKFCLSKMSACGFSYTMFTVCQAEGGDFRLRLELMGNIIKVLKIYTDVHIQHHEMREISQFDTKMAFALCSISCLIFSRVLASLSGIHLRQILHQAQTSSTSCSGFQLGLMCVMSFAWHLCLLYIEQHYILICLNGLYKLHNI